MMKINQRRIVMRFILSYQNEIYQNSIEYTQWLSKNKNAGITRLLYKWLRIHIFTVVWRDPAK